MNDRIHGPIRTPTPAGWEVRLHSVRRLGIRTFLCLGIALLTPTIVRSDTFDAPAIFEGRCAACHTVGDGRLVGPDLAGVTERRDRDWLVRFIRSSESMIADGDPLALELFEQFEQERMPDHDYSPAEIDQLLAFIAAGGPAAGKPPFLSVRQTTSEEQQAGRDLFYRGSVTGTRACAHCHSVHASALISTLYAGGSLAGVFSKYQDVELDRELSRRLAEDSRQGRRACMDQPLTAEESLAMRAFLRELERADMGGRYVDASFPVLGLGSCLAFLACAGWWSSRKGS